MASAHPPEASRARPSTLSAGIVFTATGVLQRVIALLLLPLFVAHVPVADYGRLAIAWSVAAVVAPIGSLGFETAVFRGFFVVPTADRDAYVVGNALFVAVSCVLVSVLLAGAAALAGAAVDLDVSFLFVVLALAGAALYVAATAVPLAVLRAERRLRAFAAVNLTFVGAYVLLMLWLVVAREEGATGWLLAQIGASGAAAAAAAAALWRHRAAPRLVLVGGALAFGLPLVPHALAHWVLSLSDRLLLSIWVEAAEIGRYNVAYQLAAGLGLVFVAVNHSVMADYGRALAGQLSPSRLGETVRRQVALVLVLGVAGATLGFVAIDAVLPSDYADAQLLLPWLVLANVFFGLYLIPMNSIALLAGETRRVWRMTAGAAAINVAVNIVLIPVAGAAGAAAATVVAYAVLLVLVTTRAHARAAAPSVQSIGRVAAALSAATAICAGGLLTLPSNMMLAVAVAAAWAVVASAVVILVLRSKRPFLQAPSPSRA